MIKFIKKHKLNFISYLFCAFTMALFVIISFSCKTYAYTINNDGNLVGDNLLYVQDKTLIDNGYITWYCENQTLYINGTTNDYVQLFTGFEITLNNGNYTFYNTNNTDGLYYWIGDGVTPNSILNTNSQQQNFTIETSGTYYFNVVTLPNKTFNNFAINFEIKKGHNSVQNWEPYGVWYSENNYNTLNNQYNDLINSTSQTALQGVLNNSKIKLYNYYTNEYLNLEFTINMTNPNQFDLSQDCPSLSNWLYNYDSELDPNETYKNIHAVYELNGNYTNSFVVTFDTQVMDYQFTCYYSDGTSQLLSNTDYSYNIIANPDNKTMTSFSIDYTRPDYITTIINFGLNGYSYQYGYKEGYNKASLTVGESSFQQGYINGRDYKVSSYENEINSLHSSINTLKELNAQLREQMEDNLGWSSLFFAFADTPFKVVSNVLGFELFGLNLFATFIGMITVFGVVYLLKKFI